jgi:hypothetical protein
MIGAGKNAEWATSSERSFTFLKVSRTSYPNGTCAFTLSLAGRDDAGIEIAAKPDELTRELMAITKWMEN